MRDVHTDGLRERQATREAAADIGRPLQFLCRSCYVEHPTRLDECPDCGYSDPHSVHGATTVQLRPRD
jgi:hypothetical protein